MDSLTSAGMHAYEEELKAPLTHAVTALKQMILVWNICWCLDLETMWGGGISSHITCP